MQKSSEYLIMFENDINEKTLRSIIARYKKVFLILLDNNRRQIKISDSVYDFKRNLLLEFSKRFDNTQIIESNKLAEKLAGSNCVDLIYPSIGENNDFINKFKNTYKIYVKNLVREEDLFSWKFAKKGFFKFKENIPSINNFLAKNNIS